MVAIGKTGVGRRFLISCAGEIYDLPMDRHPALRTIRKRERNRFVLAPDGAYVHWEEADTHLDPEDARILLDPVERENALVRNAQALARFGKAMAAHRHEQGVRQRDIPGLSERQVRRDEHGARVPWLP